MAWVSMGGGRVGGQRAPTPGCEGASSCETGFGVFGLLVGGSVRVNSVRPGASCNLIKKGLGALKCYRVWALGHHWPWGVSAQGRQK